MEENIWWHTPKYREELPKKSKVVLRWLRRRVQVQAAYLVGDQWEPGWEHDDLVDLATEIATGDPDALIYWDNAEECRGEGYPDGAWNPRPSFAQLIREAVIEAGRRLDAKLTLDDWLANLDNKVLYDHVGPTEKSAAEVWPGGSEDWQRRRLDSEWRCQSRGCRNIIDRKKGHARLRKYCETCRPGKARRSRSSEIPSLPTGPANLEQVGLENTSHDS